MPKTTHSNPHIGAAFDDFLEEEGIAAEVTEQAGHDVMIDQIAQAKLGCDAEDGAAD